MVGIISLDTAPLVQDPVGAEGPLSRFGYPGT